jgi:MoaA/NifB/PqqE/SkfB family radical SAM enzyme
VSREERRVQKLQRQVRRATRLGKKLRVEVRATRFVPEEQPVCEQDPRNSLFIRHDGSMAPCINLAIGGPTTFLGRPVTMPTVRYGRLPEDDPREVWDRPPCTDYRRVFAERERVYDEKLNEIEISFSLDSLREALAAARAEMPEAPDGCRSCHYLHGL